MIDVLIGNFNRIHSLSRPKRERPKKKVLPAISTRVRSIRATAATVVQSCCTITLSMAARKKGAAPSKPLTRNRRTNAQLFLDKLSALTQGEPKLIGNKSLLEELGWEQSRYTRIRAELLNQDKIIVGRGYGGSVGLATLPGARGLSVFVSYTHADEGFKNELLKHLEPLRRQLLIDAWHDRKLKAGEEWDKVISANLETADIILLLVSIDFINSKYCYDVELERALERHQSNEARVIPVILRPCMWQQTPFANLQALPKDARAVSLSNDRDEAYLNVAEGIRQVAQELLSQK